MNQWTWIMSIETAQTEIQSGKKLNRASKSYGVISKGLKMSYWSPKRKEKEWGRKNIWRMSPRSLQKKCKIINYRSKNLREPQAG